MKINKSPHRRICQGYIQAGLRRTNQQAKKISNPLIIREIQIKTTVFFQPGRLKKLEQWMMQSIGSRESIEWGSHSGAARQSLTQWIAI